jgi:hypothetical protein
VVEMNGALDRSLIPIEYRQWGSVQELPKTDAELKAGSNSDISEKFLNALGDSEEGRKAVKQTADHMVIMVNSFGGPFRCLIFTPWFGNDYTEDYATVTITYEANSTFVHEAGHCLGAFHDRYTANALDDTEDYNYGYCLPDSPYATVMSYTYRCPAPERERIMYFSNPDVSYEGIPTGDAGSNNARKMTEERDETSQYGSNCQDGTGDTTNRCSWTAWTGWTEWGSCCCLEWEERWDCPLVPQDNGMVMTSYHAKVRSNARTCNNTLGEAVSKSGCATEGDDEMEQWETKSCDCTAEESEESEESSEVTTSCVSKSGDGDEDGKFVLDGKPGNKIEYTFRTLNAAGEEEYQNTGITLRGSEGGKWNQFLYTRGSESGDVYLEEGDDGLYVNIFPYTEEGGWDFNACITEENATRPPVAIWADGCVTSSGVGKEDKEFSLPGEPGDKIEYTFRTLDGEDGEKKYQNTGITLRGSEGGKWNQFLYTRGSKSGEVELGAEDDGLYVRVFPYTDMGGWDFKACKV